MSDSITKKWAALKAVFIISLGFFAAAAHAQVEPSIQMHKVMCPPAAALVLNQRTHMWSAVGGWKSYQQSFVQQVEEFLGAQWSGINVGEVLCIYRGKDEHTFPVTLAFSHLTNQPTGHSWSKDLGGYRKCQPTQGGELASRHSCAFYVRVAVKIKDPYTWAEHLKTS